MYVQGVSKLVEIIKTDVSFRPLTLGHPVVSVFVHNELNAKGNRRHKQAKSDNSQCNGHVLQVEWRQIVFDEVIVKVAIRSRDLLHDVAFNETNHDAVQDGKQWRILGNHRTPEPGEGLKVAFALSKGVSSTLSG